jgi:TolA-binding protein
VLGVCQAGLNRPADAVATFRALLKESPDYAGADKVRYELAWALKADNQEVEAAAEFKRLAERHESSPLATEALYHLGEQQYAQQDYGAAATSYYAAMSKAGKNELGEKALHKLGWAYFRLEQYDKADKTFAAQRQMYPNSELASDAAFVQAECLFKQSKFADALTAYEQVRKTSNPEFQALALLHGGQAAGQLKQWDRSLKLLERCTAEFPNSAYLPEALYEQAWARQNQGRQDEALQLYEAVTAKSSGEAAARATFMIGEIHFERKDHKEALRHFFKAASSYSYPQWQAAAHFEAGRCFEVLGKIGQAKQSYQEVVENFPESDKVALARSRLAALSKTQ